MSKYEGTKTEKNLMEAFAGESYPEKSGNLGCLRLISILSQRE